jgi:hypothetical protein
VSPPSSPSTPLSNFFRFQRGGGTSLPSLFHPRARKGGQEGQGGTYIKKGPSYGARRLSLLLSPLYLGGRDARPICSGRHPPPALPSPTYLCPTPLALGRRRPSSGQEKAARGQDAAALARLNRLGYPIRGRPKPTDASDMLIAERLWALMGRRTSTVAGIDQLAAGLARLGIAMPQSETLVASNLTEKLAHEAAAATQALHEARALVAEAQREHVAAEAAWREAARIKAELEAASAAHAARSTELDSRAHITEMRERELETALQNVAALKSKYESKLAAIGAFVKDISSS